MEREKKSGAGLLIFLGWLMYSASYLGKLDYSANITQIMEFFQVSKSEAGMPPTFFFFAYGIGQVVNGMLCQKYNVKYMVFGSMLISAALNLFVALTHDFALVKWAWLINGFVLSVLWPTLVRLMSESLPNKDLGRTSVILGTTVAAGTLAIYGLSSVFVFLGNFKLAFYTASVVDIVVAFIWLFLYAKAVDMAKREKHSDPPEQPKEKKARDSGSLLGPAKKSFLISVFVLCFCAVGVNLIKDGLTTWVPSILKDEYGMADSLSILLTLLLPMIAVCGNTYALSVHKKVPDYVTHCLLIFAVMGVCIGLIIGSLSLGQVLLMLAGLVLTNFLASSLNSLITSIYPVFMRSKVNSGLYAGILNGFCYLGSTISSYGLGTVAERFGWSSVFWTLLGVCLMICVVCLGYFLVTRSKKAVGMS